MTQNIIFQTARAQLAVDLNCSVTDFDGASDSIIYSVARDNPGRRPFPREEKHFEMLSMGGSIVVSASPDVLEIVQPLLVGKDLDDAFAMPFVYGQSLYFLPDLARMNPLPAPVGFDYDLVEQADMEKLYVHEGFGYAINYDLIHPRPDVLAVAAYCDGQIAGIAGASVDSSTMWQVGIKINSEYRRHGLATYLINSLSIETMARGFVPYYGTGSINIASQRVAHRAGYLPAWVCAYRGRLIEFETPATG